VFEQGERAGAHEDINLITLLIGGHQSGLELLSKDGLWKKINLDDDVIICNIGDMLQRLTNNYLESTTHRVTALPDESMTSRYSIPFFVHPNPDWYIETLESCCTEDNPNNYKEGILAEDYLRERLQEIKLI
jgi:isopenicillin N synthase-like dioxygenase